MVQPLLLPHTGSIGGGSTPELAALPDRIGDRVAPITDTQEAAE